MNDRLQAAVDGRNQANAIANAAAVYLADAFAPMVGWKILKKDRELTAEAKKALNGVEAKLQGMPGFRWLTTTKYHTSVAVNIQVDTPYGDGRTNRTEVTMYLAHMERNENFEPGTHIKALAELKPDLRTDYTVGEVAAARLKVAEAKEALRDAEGGLMGFGEYDR